SVATVVHLSRQRTTRATEATAGAAREAPGGCGGRPQLLPPERRFRMLKRLGITFLLLSCLGLAGSWVAMEGAPTVEPTGAEVATTGYESFEHLLADLAKLPAPDSACALPPAPHTSCSDACGVGASNIYSAMLS